MDIYSMTGEFEYPTSSHSVLGYLNSCGKKSWIFNWSIFSWIQSYIHTCTIADYFQTILLQLSWFKFYMDRADESWMREQKGVGELSVCMGTSVGTRMFMRIKVRSLPFWVTGTYVEAIPFHFSSFNFFNWIFFDYILLYYYLYS